LNDTLNESTYISINETQYNYATDFDICHNIIKTINVLRGSMININAKKPLKSASIIVDNEFNTEYSTRYQKYLSFVTSECNILDLKIIDRNLLNVKKIVSINKVLIFKKYGKNVMDAFNVLTKMNSYELIMMLDNNTLILDYEFDESMFNVSYEINIKDSTDINADYIFKEFKYGIHNVTILVDKFYDTHIDSLYYYRCVANRIQQARKHAGLHTWDVINTYYSGEPKYLLDCDTAQQHIKSITKYSLIRYTDEPIFFTFDATKEVGLIIYLQKL
jgi:hypothetical protein